MRILILGSSGLLGHKLFNTIFESSGLEVYGTIRNDNLRSFFNAKCQSYLLTESDLLSVSNITILLKKIKPDVVINCISVRNWKSAKLNDLIATLSFFPRQLSILSELFNFKLIHISSDGVFSGARGSYMESDIPDPSDDYGLAKFLGESISSNGLVLRTSIIGPELTYKQSFFEWFLTQDKCIGYTDYIFSALPTSFLSRALLDIILLNKDLRGIYHIGSEPISKFDLMVLIAGRFKKQVNIVADNSVKINRSLNCSKLIKDTNFHSPKWVDLINEL